MSDAELMKSRYAEAYRKLIALARDNGADIALATSSMAVNEDESARGQGLLRRGVQADRRHHRRQRRPQSHGAAASPATRARRCIDMTAGVDGQWDDDLYLDIVHFTEAGNERVAGVIFRQLVPILAERDGLRCVLR